jgi:putative membrane protein
MGMSGIARHENPVLVGLTLLALAASGIQPYDRLTWVLETFPVMLGLPLAIATHRRFPLTPLVYRLLFVHGLILMLGGHYTYARVPAGFWLQEALDLARNHYDRLGHLAQGFVPALLAREILVRATPLRPGGWLFFLTTSVVLAISASYEFIEWGVALVMGMDADAFLATQGDVWDTQWDMFLALLGALAAQILLVRLHDRQLARLI